MLPINFGFDPSASLNAAGPSLKGGGAMPAAPGIDSFHNMLYAAAAAKAEVPAKTASAHREEAVNKADRGAAGDDGDVRQADRQNLNAVAAEAPAKTAPAHGEEAAKEIDRGCAVENKHTQPTDRQDLTASADTNAVAAEASAHSAPAHSENAATDTEGQPVWALLAQIIPSLVAAADANATAAEGQGDAAAEPQGGRGVPAQVRFTVLAEFAEQIGMSPQRPAEIVVQARTAAGAVNSRPKAVEHGGFEDQGRGKGVNFAIQTDADAAIDVKEQVRHRTLGKLQPARRLFFLGGPLDFADLLPARIVQALGLQEQLAVSQDARQQVVEVVGHASSQPADRLHLLRLLQLLLQVPAVRDVQDDPLHVGRTARVVDHVLQELVHPAQLGILAHDAVFAFQREARHQPQAGDERQRGELSQVHRIANAVIARVRLGQQRELPARPVEAAGVLRAAGRGVPE